MRMNQHLGVDAFPNGAGEKIVEHLLIDAGPKRSFPLALFNDDLRVFPFALAAKPVDAPPDVGRMVANAFHHRPGGQPFLLLDDDP